MYTVDNKTKLLKNNIKSPLLVMKLFYLMVYVRHNVNFFVCISFEKVLNIMCRGELIMRKFVILLVLFAIC